MKKLSHKYEEKKEAQNIDYAPLVMTWDWYSWN